MNYPRTKLLKRRRTKIVATLGPASEAPAVLDRLVAAGVDVFRLNLSHGTQDYHRTLYERVRDAAARAGRVVAVLADLCGPKVRVGRFPGGHIDLKTGDRVTVTTRDVGGGPGLIPSQYEPFARDVRPGDRVLLDDGLIELRVEAVAGTEVSCAVIDGGVLKDRKGMNLPGVEMSTPALTDKDRADARFAAELGVDFLALSFVRRAADVDDLKSLLNACGRRVPVVAKIELPQALEAIDCILEVSDGVMVARGDLGVELPPEVVPVVQRQLVAQARRRNKPAIVATQMLESMVTNPRPTRAEVSDVSTAVFSGADAVMLSAETSVGAHPVAAVEMMDRVARQIESLQWSEGHFGTIARPDDDGEPPLPINEAAARATAQLSRDLWARALVVLARTGATAGVMAAARPAAPLLAVSADPVICRRMNLLWGVIPVGVTAAGMEAPEELARRLARELGLAEAGQFVLLVSGFGGATPTGTPVISVLRV